MKTKSYNHENAAYDCPEIVRPTTRPSQISALKKRRWDWRKPLISFVLSVTIMTSALPAFGEEKPNDAASNGGLALNTASSVASAIAPGSLSTPPALVSTNPTVMGTSATGLETPAVTNPTVNNPVPGTVSTAPPLPVTPNVTATPMDYNLLSPGLEFIDPSLVKLYPYAKTTLSQGQPVLIPLGNLNPSKCSLQYALGGNQFWAVQSPATVGDAFLWKTPAQATAKGRIKVMTTKGNPTPVTLYSGLFAINSTQWSNQVTTGFVDTDACFSWQPVAAPSGTIAYNVFRSTTPGNWSSSSELISANLTGTSCQIAQPANGKKYYYKVAPIYNGNYLFNIYPEVSLKMKSTLAETVGTTTAYINGNAITINHAPVLVNYRVFVSLSSYTYNTGANLTWDDLNKVATVVYNGTTVVYTAGSTTYMVNGTPEQLDIPPFVDNGLLMITPRSYSDAFGQALSWDEQNKTVGLLY